MSARFVSMAPEEAERLVHHAKVTELTEPQLDFVQRRLAVAIQRESLALLRVQRVAAAWQCELIPIRQLPLLLNLSASRLAQLAANGEAPPVVRIGRLVYARRVDLQCWISEIPSGQPLAGDNNDNGNDDDERAPQRASAPRHPLAYSAQRLSTSR